MSVASKACPVLFRDSSLRHILAFEHPRSGVQLVKGGIAPGEDARAAALRELQEEAGVADTAIARDLGLWDSEHHGQVWSLHLCTFRPELPEKWVQHGVDEDGQELRFFWHDVNEDVDARWHPVYRKALAEIRARTRMLKWCG